MTGAKCAGTTGSPLPGILDDVGVLEIGHMVAGPMCTQILADCGAVVQKIEPYGRDVARTLGPLLDGDSSGVYASVNRRKRLLALSEDTAASQIAEAVASCDVLVTNVTPRVLDDLGLRLEQLVEERPGLIVVRITAGGPDGTAGTDSMAQATMGLSSMTGPRAGEPYRVGAPVVDVAAGTWAAYSVLLALRAKERTGAGRLVDISLTDVCLHLQAPFVTAYPAGPELIRRSGNESQIACAPALNTRDGRIVFVLLHDGHWHRLCDVLGQPFLVDDERFRTSPQRQRRQQDLVDELQPVFLQRTATEWESLLHDAGVPCSVERDYRQVLGDESLWRSGTLYCETSEEHIVPTVALPMVIDGARLPAVGERAEWLQGES